MSEIDDPFVSILIPVFNREEYIVEAIDSVLNSTYQHYEVIVVDDASQDNTWSIVKAYSQKDKRIKVFQNETNLGQFQNRNKAARLAKGKYLKYVDSDDIIYPHTLEMMIRILEKHPDAGLGMQDNKLQACTPYPVKSFPVQTYRDHFMYANLSLAGPSAWLIRKKAFDKINGFHEDNYVGNDTLFLLDLAAVVPILILPPGLIWWRIHSDQAYHSGIESKAYEKYNYSRMIDLLNALSCPFDADLRTKALKFHKWKHARRILFHGLKYLNITTAFRLWKYSDLSMLDLLRGLFKQKH